MAPIALIIVRIVGNGPKVEVRPDQRDGHRNRRHSGNNASASSGASVVQILTAASVGGRAGA